MQTISTAITKSPIERVCAEVDRFFTVEAAMLAGNLIGAGTVLTVV